MSLPKWNEAVDGPRYKAHSNKHKRLRALARLITKQGTSKAAPLRGMIAKWWKLVRGHDFSMRERFEPPKRDQGVLERMAAHFRGDYSEGWPDPAKFRIWVVVHNMPDTFRWAYRRLKGLGRRLKHA